ncbi:MAG TPA: glutathione S-transferase family protein, partial [Xanthomonadales bacterium]|nr:glutathione S-transferase family protein [Xanthomonadales bacterium]
YSSWSLRPWLFLHAFGVDTDDRILPLDTPQFREQIGALSPTARVPALHHDGVIVWDSLAICEYANEAFLDGRGLPADRAVRAVARSVCAEMHSGFQSLRTECPMNVRRRVDPPAKLSESAQGDIERVCSIWRECRARYGAGGDFLFGAFSMADAFFAPVATRFRTYGVTVGAVERRYMDAIFALPAFREWEAMSVAETESLPKYDRIGA